MSPTVSSHPDRRRISHPLLRHGVRVAAASGLAAALAAAPAVQATAQPGDKPSPNSSAKKAGITSSEGGYAGWAMRGQQQPRTATAQPKKVSGIPGIDVSAYQGSVNWKKWWSKGKRFAYVKATEGSSYKSPDFSKQYTGSYKAGMTRGAYHFARPDGASAAKQASYFAAHGGGWSADGKTLPGMLDVEDNYTGGDRCYGKSSSQMVSWVDSFIKKYRAKTSRDPVIYTNASFWKKCLGNTSKFNQVSPLSIAHWSSKPPKSLPGGWSYYTFWQYSGSGTDLDAFNGSKASLKKLANG